MVFHLSAQRQFLQTNKSRIVRPLLVWTCMGKASTKIKRRGVPKQAQWIQHQPSANKFRFRTDFPQAPQVHKHLPEPNYDLSTNIISDDRGVADSRQPEQIVSCDSESMVRRQHTSKINTTSYKVHLSRHMLSEDSDIEGKQQPEQIGSCESESIVRRRHT